MEKITMTVLPSSEGNVFKHLFESETAVYEAVVYRYKSFEERTVVCISVQCGCAVGCVFCGTGKKFVRDLFPTEIIQQVDKVFKYHNINTKKVKKLQIMFMSMGEPMYNYSNVHWAIHSLHDLYPNAQLLLSTSGANKRNEAWIELLQDSISCDKIGLQFSIHASNDELRDKIIPHQNKKNLEELRNYGMLWHDMTGRQVYLNYCVNSNNAGDKEFKELTSMFPPKYFAFTFSVICSKDETMKDAGYRELDKIKAFADRFLEAGYNTRVFDPAGQDDIGGGCGQLFFVQKKMQEKIDAINDK